MGIQCFMLLRQDGLAQVGLRRYVSKRDRPEVPDCPLMPGEASYHQAMTCRQIVPVTVTSERPRDGWLHVDQEGHYGAAVFDWPPDGDPAWPGACDCGYPFDSEDRHQRWVESVWSRADNGDLTTTRDAPPGAMWDAWWTGRKGPDGRSLMVKCPNGAQWAIDGRASNCTLPDDHEHRCWVRHGEPPNVTVGKDGLTCQAGAGSIQAGDYHGFLRGGAFDP